MPAKVARNAKGAAEEACRTVDLRREERAKISPEPISPEEAVHPAHAAHLEAEEIRRQTHELAEAMRRQAEEHRREARKRLDQAAVERKQAEPDREALKRQCPND
jgi:hypothetical protein